MLLNLDKVIEKLMHKRLVGCLNEEKIIYCKQYGSSTVHAIFNLTDNIESAIDNKQFVCWVFIDLQKAFDKVELITTFYLKKYNTME